MVLLFPLTFPKYLNLKFVVRPPAAFLRSWLLGSSAKRTIYFLSPLHPSSKPSLSLLRTLGLPGTPGHTNRRLQRLLAALHVPKSSLSSIFSSSSRNNAMMGPPIFQYVLLGPLSALLQNPVHTPFFWVRKSGASRLQDSTGHSDLDPSRTHPHDTPSKIFLCPSGAPTFEASGQPPPQLARSRIGGGRGGRHHGLRSVPGEGGGARTITPGGEEG